MLKLVSSNIYIRSQNCVIDLLYLAVEGELNFRQYRHQIAATYGPLCWRSHHTHPTLMGLENNKTNKPKTKPATVLM